MSDLDKGAALLHMWKRQREGGGYAVQNYPCQYIEHPSLAALSRAEACRHAVSMCGSHREIEHKLGDVEHDRLYNLALTEGDKILDSRKLWGARHENGNVSPCGTEDSARFLVMNPSWRCVELLHRSEPGGEWSVVFDARGLEQESELKWTLPGDSVLWDGQWRQVASNDARVPRIGPAVRTVEFADGVRVELSDQGESRWTVPIRRRTAVPEAAA